MAGKSRKISFYRLSIDKKEPIAGSRMHRIIALSNEEVENHFKMIYDNRMHSLSNGRKAMQVVASSGSDVVEVLEYTNHTAFIKIGQQNPSNTVALRDRVTLETEAVPMNPNQLLELFTYCYVDFLTGIVSYISISGAPRVSTFRNMFDNAFLHEEGLATKLAAIMTKDVLETLMRKSKIGKITVTVAVPEDEILSDIGLSIDDYDAIENLRTRTATYKLVGRRNKSLFRDSNMLVKTIEAIRSKYGDNIEALSASAKDENEMPEEYDLLQYSFTKTVTFERDDIETLAPGDFKNILVTTYNANKTDLLRYSRI